jgi:Ca-activated chloride channel family protein
MIRWWVVCVLWPALAAAQALDGHALEALKRVRTDPGDLPRLRVKDASAGELPLKRTDVFAEVSGFVAHVDVSQTYRNDQERAIEAVYVFPLPENAAVDDLTIRVGDRVIRAEIRKREDARRTYEDAKAQGHTAALLEQERPNVFTQSVANIPPGEDVEVTISYVQDLTYDAGEYEFVFPMVVGPRFFPGEPTGAKRGTGWATDTDAVPDASRVSPPIVGAGERTGNDISIEVLVDPGLPLVDLEVPTHETEAATLDDGRFDVKLSPHDSIPNRDFVMRWRVDGDAPQAAVLSHTNDQGGFFSLVVQPPALDVDALVGDRELVFVVDVSGSMSGLPLGHAKGAMREALRRIRPGDTFDVITFAGHTARAFGTPRPANAANIRTALEFVERAEAGGGTYMANAVAEALRPPPADGRNRYVVFLTDGFVGNETQIFDLARAFAAAHLRRGQHARVFGVGVGSSVNRYLIDGLSKAGDGVPVYADLREDPVRAVEQVFHVIDHPVLEDVHIDWGKLPVASVEPETLPDLYATRPLIVHGRFDGPARGRAVVSGRMNGKAFRLPVDVDLPAKQPRNEALASLWARSRVETLERRLWSGPDAEAEGAITQLGLDFRLVTAFTSFVAVDRSRVVGDGRPATVAQPVEPPEGVDVQAATGGLTGNAVGESYGAAGFGLGGKAAFDAKLQAAMSGTGDELVVGHGAGGMALRGTGGGGGGFGRVHGMGRVDTGAEAAAPAPRADVGEVTGALDTSVVARVIAAHRAGLRFCYERSLQKRPGLAGKVVLRIVIQADGKVTLAEIAETTLNDADAEACMTRSVARWQFPAIAGGKVEIRFPIVFQAM